MMDRDFSEWYRVANIEPTDILLKSRWQGIENYLDNDITCSDTLELVRLFFKKSTQKEFYDTFIDSFIKADSTFPQKGNVIELSILAGAIIKEVVETINGINSIALLAVQTMAFNNRDVAVPEMFYKIREKFAEETALIRSDISSTLDIEDEIPSNEDLLNTIKQAQETDVWEIKQILGMPFQNYLIKMNNYFASINEQKRKTSIYSEDSQVLWWMTGEWSRDLNMPFKQIDLPMASIIIGKELADLITIAPGPYSAQAVIHKVISQCRGKIQSKSTLTNNIDSLSREWRAMAIAKYKPMETDVITPILTGITKSLEVGKEREWLSAFENMMKFDAERVKMLQVDFAYQMYLECLLIKSINAMEE